jgi:hypothetical protein
MLGDYIISLMPTHIFEGFGFCGCSIIIIIYTSVTYVVKHIL